MLFFFVVFVLSRSPFDARFFVPTFEMFSFHVFFFAVAYRAASLLIVVEMIAFGLFSFHLELEVSSFFAAATPMCEFLS